jgi:ubiquinone/menaquinone biosynthesis C-methylase UbiE
MADAAAPPTWNDYAADYESVHEPLTQQFAKAALDRVPVAAGQEVLDVASGPGTLALLAARAGAAVIAIDNAPGMIARAGARLREHGHAGSAARVMDVARLDFADARFDAVFCVFGIMVVPDYRAAFAEMARVAKPGGRAAIVMWAGLERMQHVQVWLRAIADAFPQFQPAPPPASWLVLQEAASLARLIADAGFAEVEVRTETRWWDVASPAWFARHADLSPAAESLYRTLGPDARSAVRRCLEAELRRRHGDGSFRLAAAAHIAVGLRPRAAH